MSEPVQYSPSPWLCLPPQLLDRLAAGAVELLERKAPPLPKLSQRLSRKRHIDAQDIAFLVEDKICCVTCVPTAFLSSSYILCLLSILPPGGQTAPSVARFSSSHLSPRPTHMMTTLMDGDGCWRGSRRVGSRRGDGSSFFVRGGGSPSSSSSSLPEVDGPRLEPLRCDVLDIEPRRRRGDDWRLGGWH